MNKILHSFTLFGKAFTVFLLLQALYWVPYLVGDFILFLTIPEETVYMVSAMGFSLLLTVLIVPVVHGGYFAGLRDVEETGSTNFKQCFQVGTERFVPVLIASLIVGLLVLLGFVLVIVPGILVALHYALVLPVVVFENRSLGDAMKRSGELMKGRKGQLFFIWLVLFCVGMTMGFFMGFGGAFLGEGLTFYVYTSVLALVLGVAQAIVNYGVLWCFYKEAVEDEQFAEDQAFQEEAGPAV